MNCHGLFSHVRILPEWLVGVGKAADAVHALVQFIKIIGDGLRLLRAIVQQIHAGAKGLATGQSFDVPANVLSCATHAQKLAVQRVVVLQMVK